MKLSKNPLNINNFYSESYPVNTQNTFKQMENREMKMKHTIIIMYSNTLEETIIYTTTTTTKVNNLMIESKMHLVFVVFFFC